MTSLIDYLRDDHVFMSSIQKCESQITPILQRYLTNFPDFTDHSIEHAKRVLQYASFLIQTTASELNKDEIYILIMGCYLHDIGMAPDKKIIRKIKVEEDCRDFINKSKGNYNYKDYIREIHHILSYDFILDNWQRLEIPNHLYAKAIAIIAKGHRKEELIDENVFQVRFPVRTGRDFVCLPYLACILRLADELDITNDRTPDLLFDKFLPENKVSKKEWMKHRVNYVISFDRNKIVITAECNKQLYESQLRHYKEIEGVLSYVNKVIRNLSSFDRKLTLDFNEIVPRINTEGFIPKDISFNLDLQNTVDALMGKNLYHDKYVAIREALQNSIDSCRYKKFLNKIAKSQISIYLLKDNRLIIEDNGLGMDEFIVENYFAKIASSYYKQKSISKNFEAISEFGIGILSYFLICDYFEVETKMENKESLRFRVTKNANTHFYFYDNNRKRSTGTKLTFFLNDSLSFENLRSIVAKYIRFVEIPIKLNSENQFCVVRSQGFKIDKANKLHELVRIASKENISNLTIVSKKIEKANYSCFFHVIFGKGKDGNLLPTSLYNIVNEGKVYIELSHKGIFVNNFLSYLRNIFGQINIKKKIDLKLDRNGVLNRSTILTIINEFYISIIQYLFSRWKKYNNRKKAEMTQLIIRYMSSRELIKRGSYKVFWKSFVCNVFRDNKVEYIKLKNVHKKYPQILLYAPYIVRDAELIDKLSEIYKATKMPILFMMDDYYPDFYLELFTLLEKEIYTMSALKQSFYVVSKRQGGKVFKFPFRYPNFRLLKSANNWIATPIRCGTVYPLNLNHRITRYFLKEKHKIIKDIKLHDLWYQFLRELHDVLFSKLVERQKMTTKNIGILNRILNYINKNGKSNLTLRKNDFAPWMFK